MNVRSKYLKTFNFLKPRPQMIFISGPRQSGKTTFAQGLMASYTTATYLNWDIAADRKKILADSDLGQAFIKTDRSQSLVVLDEIHKFSDWKNLLKGLYDQYKNESKILVTGSGRLDFFKKGNDSLAGRYFLFHMWPLTISEFCDADISYDRFVKDPLTLHIQDQGPLAETWRQLSLCSGFPDPYFSGDEKVYRIWSDTYRNQLIREDVRQLTRLEKIDLLEKLVLLLPHKIGSPLSMDKIAQDVGVAFETIKKWLLVLERFFICFRLTPWSKKIGRSITKEKKLYLYDYPSIPDLGARFENMIALELLRAVSTWRERGEGRWELHYVKDRDQKEVDFLLACDQKPFLLVEAKLSDTAPSESLVKFTKQLNVPGVQLVSLPNVRKYSTIGPSDILVASAWDWLAALP
jgi:uncharacterized protein